jgi:multiple sugar transport system substrate-binding protein
MFAAICVSLGAPPASGDPADGDPATEDPAFTDRAAGGEAGGEALDIMADLLAHADATLARRNPIAALDAMAAEDGPAYCALVYGYISYQRPGQHQRPDPGQHPAQHALTAFDAPAGPAGIGSVLGGTGIAVTRSCTRLDAARDYIRHLLSEETQVRRYADVGGQSADRRAWLDPDADGQARGFYSATRRTVEAAWVRPRFAGYLEFQARASAVLRDGLISGANHNLLLNRVNELFAGSTRGIYIRT